MVSLKSTLSLVGASAVAAQQCQNITIPVSVNATNSVLNQNAPYPQNQSQVTAFISSFITIPQPSSANFINGTFQNVETYNITATYCPATTNSTSKKALQILVHGIGFDKSYWDFTPATSYVAPIRAAGYDTLAIDRLGCGSSSKPDGRDQVQTATHVDYLSSITLQARAGTLPGVNTSYAETVHVGHSYGSIISASMVGMYPTITDGLVLTGFSTNSTWVPQTFAAFNPVIANVDILSRFGNTTSAYLNNTYLTWSNIYNNQLAFFYYPYYNQSTIELDEATKQPVTYGEIVTMSSLLGETNFTGPVQIVTGANDAIFCGGNCTATGSNLTSIPMSAQLIFPKVDNFKVITPLNAGHAVQLHLQNQNITQQIISFLKGASL